MITSKHLFKRNEIPFKMWNSILFNDGGSGPPDDRLAFRSSETNCEPLPVWKEKI